VTGHDDYVSGPAHPAPFSPRPVAMGDTVQWKPWLLFVANIMYAKAGDYRKATQSIWRGGVTASAVVLPIDAERPESPWPLLREKALRSPSRPLGRGVYPGTAECSGWSVEGVALEP